MCVNWSLGWTCRMSMGRASNSEGGMRPCGNSALAPAHGFPRKNVLSLTIGKTGCRSGEAFRALDGAQTYVPPTFARGFPESQYSSWISALGGRSHQLPKVCSSAKGRGYVNPFRLHKLSGASALLDASRAGLRRQHPLHLLHDSRGGQILVVLHQLDEVVGQDFIGVDD